ncbi:MAG TPA: hypothetical protein VJ602_11845 [Paludibacter sp.]|nr:hypothetical protein [Paludibacter sp.]
MKNKIIKYGGIIGVVGFMIVLSVAIYMFNKPKRNIAKTKAEYALTATQLITEFIQNEPAANSKYLSAAYGKVIQVSGIIGEINLTGDTILNLSLKEPGMKSGSVNCSMQRTELNKIKLLKIGDKVTVKGECTGYLNITNEVSVVKCLLEE